MELSVQQFLDGLQRLRVDGVVERRGDRDACDRVRRALRQRVKGADVLDDVAEELDADGRGGAGREDVQDAASTAGGAGGLDGGLHAVAHARPPDQQGAGLHVLAHRQRVSGVRELVGPQRALAQCGNRGDEQQPRPIGAVLQRQQRGEHAEPVVGDGLVLREPLVGERLALRQAQHRGRVAVLAEDRRELVRNAVGVLRLGGDDQHGAAQAAAESGQQETAGGVGGREAQGHGRTVGVAHCADRRLKRGRFAEEVQYARESHCCPTEMRFTCCKTRQ